MIARAELQARLEALQAVPDFDDGRLAIHPERLIAYANGHPLQLSGREMTLLIELRRHAGRSRSRAQLIKAIWGPEKQVLPHSVDVLVARIRSKLESAIPDVAYIRTCHGRGYTFGLSPDCGC